MSAGAEAVAVALVVALARRPRVRRSASPRRADASRWRVDAAPLRVAAVVAIAAAGFVIGGPALGVSAAVAGVSAVPLAARVQRRRLQAAVAASVPDLVDLFLVSASAGQPVAGSLAVVAPRAPTAVAPLVSQALDRFRRGLPLAECLDGLGADLGPDGVPLTDALRQAAATGVPLVPLLSGVATAARDARRRRAQEVARRLPVTMLFPLVACILPAAVALAVVPVLLVSVSSLSP